MLEFSTPRPALVPGQHAVSASSSICPASLPMSRFQLVWAILMFLGVPAMDADDRACAGQGARGRAISPTFPAGLAIGALRASSSAMYLSPKLAGLADILLTRGGAARYGGAAALPRGRRDRDRVLVPARRRHRPSASTLFMIGLAFGTLGSPGTGRRATRTASPGATAVRGAVAAPCCSASRSAARSRALAGGARSGRCR